LLKQDEELEDVRAAFQKKLKIVEQQLENEHEDRLNFLHEKHELETKIITLQELAARSGDEDQVRIYQFNISSFISLNFFIPTERPKRREGGCLEILLGIV